MTALVRQMVAAIQADDASFIAEAAERIKTRMRTSIVETGRDLLAVKSVLPHGEFGRWLASAVDISERSARNYMNAARLADEKSATVAVLPPLALYALSAPTTPETAQAAIVKRIEAGEHIDTAAVLTVVKQARAAERDAHLTPEELKARAAREKRRHAAETKRIERDRAEAEVRAAERHQRAAKAAAFLRDRLGDDVEKLRALMVGGVQWHEVDAALRGGSGEATQ